MKKMKRIIALTFIFIMMFTMNVFADGSIVDVTETDPYEQDDPIVTIDNTTNSEGIVPLAVSTCSTKSELDTLSTIDRTPLEVAASRSYYTVKSAASGYMYLYITSDQSNANAVAVQKLSSKNKNLGTIISSLNPGETKRVLVSVKKNTTYHIYMKNAAQGAKFAAKAVVVYGSKSRSLTEAGQDYVATGHIYGTKKTYTTYWKVKTTTKGTITAYVIDYWNNSADSTQPLNVTLLNSKKKAISATSSVKGIYDDSGVHYNNVSYGTNAGTYYIKVTTKAPVYDIKFKTDGTYSDGVATKRSKSITLTEGVTRNTVLNASRSSGSNFYKIVVSQDATVNISFRMLIAPGTKMNVQLLNSKGKTLTLNMASSGTSSSKLTYTGATPSTSSVQKAKISAKLSAGTYYVRLYKNTKTTSAAYSISYTQEAAASSTETATDTDTSTDTEAAE